MTTPTSTPGSNIEVDLRATNPRTDFDVSEDYVLEARESSIPDGVVLDLVVDDNGSTVTDQSGNGYNATVTGGTWESESTLSQNYTWDAESNGKITVPFDIGGSSELCLATLVNVPQWDDTVVQSIHGYEGSDSSDRPFYIRSRASSNFRFYVDNGAVIKTPAASNWATGQWIVVITQITGSKAQAYSNDTRVVNVDYSGSLTSTIDSEYLLGNLQAGSSRGLRGNIGRHILYDRSLSDSEISSLVSGMLP